MSRGLFITGTDTGVGKTVLTALLLGHLRRGGISAMPMKPIQTGCARRQDRLDAPDLEFALRVAELELNEEDRQRLCPLRYETACSPHLAAELEHRPIHPESLIRSIRDLAGTRGPILAEGAGGLLVPITRTFGTLDLAVALGWPVLIAARDGLGTLNHSLLTLHRARQAGLDVLGIVPLRSAPGSAGAIEQDNLRTLREIGGVDVFGPVPHLGDVASRPPQALLAETSEVFAPLVRAVAKRWGL